MLLPPDEDGNILERYQGPRIRRAALGARRRATPPSVKASDAENMYLAEDGSGIRRTRRQAPRTAVCRPALAWLEGAPSAKCQGVLLDVTPYGMRLRVLDAFEVGTVLIVQMMRDDEFSYPLSGPIRSQVVHACQTADGFFDLGLKRHLPKIRKPGETAAPVRPDRPAAPRASTAPRLYSAEDIAARRGPRRTGRNRG